MTTAAETSVLEQLRDAVRVVLHQSAGPMATTAITCEVGRVPTHLVYRALVVMERAGEVQRAGRAGTAARAEVPWQLAGGECNAAFAELLAELEHAEISEDAQAKPTTQENQ